MSQHPLAWEHGHYVMSSYSRRPEKLQDLVREIGSHARSGSTEDAVRYGNVVLLAVPWAAIGDALSDAGPLNRKILISCVNPFGARGLEVGLTTSAAEEISKLTPDAAVGEAFNTVFASILHSGAHLFRDNMPTVFNCGDDTGAKDKVAELIGDAGLQPVDAGALQNARYIEALRWLITSLKRQ